MPSTPWAIQRRQKKTPSTAPAARKRSRLSDDVGRRVASASRSRSQQTLTQIAFINSPQTSFEDDLDLQELKPLTEPKEDEQSVAKPRNKLKKRESTLTQMPWLNDHSPQAEPFDEALLTEVNANPREEARIVQFDGAYDSPRKPRKRKSAGEAISIALDSFDNEERETQDYLPTKKRKTLNANTVRQSSERRRSGRIASKDKPFVQDSSENSGVFENAFYSKVRSTSNSITKTRPPVLEIADSTELDDEELPTMKQNNHRQYIPITPRKIYIASSQTPESQSRTIRREANRTDLSPSKAPTRTPLAERNPNLPPRLLRSNRKQKRPLSSPAKQSPPRKICVLKVPRRGLLPRNKTIDDSQEDLYSLQPTSPAQQSSKTSTPPQKGSNKQRNHDEEQEKQLSASNDSSPHLDSALTDFDTQESLPTISELISARPAAKQQLIRHDINKPNMTEAISDSIVVRDFGADLPVISQPPVTPKRATMLPKDSVTVNSADNAVATKNDDISNEVLSEFGSPILNDTQFIADLDQRTSSPVPNIGVDTSMKWKRQNDAEDEQDDTVIAFEQKVPTHTDPVQIEESDTAISNSLPTPQLVLKTGSATATSQSVRPTNTNAEPILPQTSQRSSFRTITKRVRLNDTRPDSLPSTLPSQHLNTQRSVYPASLLRPSQVSTQDPTQGYFPSSIAPGVHDLDDDEIDRISIKDSSSSSGQLNDHVRPHRDQSQSPGLDVTLTISSDNELDDLDLNVSGVAESKKNQLYTHDSTGQTDFDLDPASASRHSVRKALLRTSSGVDSNMRSIHGSSSDYERNETSSPPRNVRSQMPTTTQRKYDVNKAVLDLFEDIPTSSPSPPPLKRKYSPIAGLDNDTQSNFTQGGTITAAYIHRQREAGLYPEWFIPTIPPKTKKTR